VTAPGSALPERLERTKLLVVEGDDETRLLSRMLQGLGRDDIQLINCRGKDNMPGALQAFPQRPGFAEVEAVAIVRDAEESSSSAFQSVSEALRRGGVMPPPEPGQFTEGRPRVGILILPPGRKSGMLEDVCLESVAGDPALRCVDEFFRCVQSEAKRAPRSPSRSRVCTWLASQVDPYIRIGEAAERGLWPLDGPVFEPLRFFLSAI